MGSCFAMLCDQKYLRRLWLMNYIFLSGDSPTQWFGSSLVSLEKLVQVWKAQVTHGCKPTLLWSGRELNGCLATLLQMPPQYTNLMYQVKCWWSVLWKSWLVELHRVWSKNHIFLGIHKEESFLIETKNRWTILMGNFWTKCEVPFYFV